MSDENQDKAAESQEAAETEPKAEAKAEVKTEVKAEVKTEAAPEAKTEAAEATAETAGETTGDVAAEAAVELEEELEEGRGRRKKMVGVVVSDKMSKTRVVKVQSLKMHPRYKKYVRKDRRFKAHDETEQSKTGDKVVIQETRPYSKTKRWRIVEVVGS